MFNPVDGPPLKVLVVGGGMISAEVVLPTVFEARRWGWVGDVSVATRRGSTVRALRARFPGEAFAGFPAQNGGGEAEDAECYREAIAALGSPGVVIVATPDDFHTPVAMAALDRGCDVIVEKPLCLTVEDARAIGAKAAAGGHYVYTDFHKRHDKAVLAARYKFRRGELGEMLCGHAWIEERREMPLEHFQRWAGRSSSFEYVGCHYVDAYHFITGLLPRRMIGFAQSKLLRRMGHDAKDAGQAVIEWEDGSVLYVQTSWVLPDSNPNLTNQGLQLTGTEGEYRADHADRNCNFVTVRHGFERFNPHFLKSYDDWDDPDRTVEVGYGADSVLQPLHDIRRLHAAGRTGGDGARRDLLARFEDTRPLPRQALVSTAAIEAFRMSVAAGGAWVGFGTDLAPRLESRGEARDGTRRMAVGALPARGGLKTV